MLKNLFLGVLCITMLTACDDWWDGISSSGGDSEKPADTQVASMPTSSTSSAAAEPTGSASDPVPVEVDVDTSSLTQQQEASSEPAATTAAATSSSSNDKCGIGHYDFRTDSDGKKHFDFRFLAGGVVQYYLKDGPKGRWSWSGNQITLVGPFGPGWTDLPLHMTVTQVASDCRLMEFKGRSPGGAAVTSRRM